MHVYTKKGDHGQTNLADGTAHEKSEAVFEAIGGIDELNSWIGVIISNIEYRNPKNREPASPSLGGQIQIKENFKIEKQLNIIQNNLFAVGSILAKAKNIKFDVTRETEILEKEIDKMEKELPPLTNFILPGGTELSALLHICRTVCRKTERKLVRYQCNNTSIPRLVPYFNRLSDYFFTIARRVNHQTKTKEKIWKV